MKSNFLTEFVEKAKDNSKTAFIYKDWLSYRKVSFSEFLSDVYRMNGYLKERLHGDNVLVFSYPYSYLFFVGIFSCVFLGKNIVIVDSFRDKKKTRSMMEQAQVTDILTDGRTRFLTFLLPGRTPQINLVKFNGKQESIAGNVDIAGRVEPPKNSSSIITFTSGTTGMPKAIKRPLDFLESQIKLIKDNADIRENDVVYGLLPMYTLLSVLMNNTCLVSRDMKACDQFGATMLLAPIKKVLEIDRPLRSIQRAFFGGAILYKKDAEAIAAKLPSAEITYVYGASEGAVIYKTQLRDYLKEPFTFYTKSKGIDVSIVNPDENGVGEIQIAGETVIGAAGAGGVAVHNTGDFGKLVDGKLILVGRKKYSCSAQSFYNYEYDEYLRKNNPQMKAGFSFFYEGRIHVAYTGVIVCSTSGANCEDGACNDVVYHRFAELPYDLKHKTKLDYGKVIEKIKH